MPHDIQTELVSLISTHFEIDRQQLEPSTELADLGADSLDLVDLAMLIEQHFSVQIPDTDYDRLTSVEQATAYLAQRLASPA